MECQLNEMNAILERISSGTFLFLWSQLIVLRCLGLYFITVFQNVQCPPEILFHQLDKKVPISMVKQNISSIYGVKAPIKTSEHHKNTLCTYVVYDIRQVREYRKAIISDKIDS